MIPPHPPSSPHMQQQPTHLLPSPMYPAPGFGYDPTYCQYLGQAADGYQYELVRRPSVGAELMVPSYNQMVQRRLSGSGGGGGTGSASSNYPQSHSPVPPAAAAGTYTSTTPALTIPGSSTPHLVNLASMPGSFDSCGPPPPTPIFIQQQISPSPQPPYRAQPILVSSSPIPPPSSASPRHYMTTAPANLYATQAPLPPLVSSSAAASNLQQQQQPTAGSSSNVAAGKAMSSVDAWHGTAAAAAVGEMPKPIQETSI